MFKLELTKDQEQHALDLHKKAIVTDSLQGVLTSKPDKYFPEFVEGGINVTWNGVAGDIDPFPEVPPLGFGDVVMNLDKLRDVVKTHQNKFVFVEYAEDVKRAKKEGKIAFVPHMQGCAGPIENNYANLRALHKLGLKIIQLTYNSQTSIGTGCCELWDTGLTIFGKMIVEEMNKVGIIVDVSHCGDATRNDAIELSKYPVIESHSSVRAICPTLRNTTDESIKAMAEKGGVIGLCAWAPLLSLDNTKKRATLNDFLDHIDYVEKLVGTDYIGISTDTNYIGNDEGWSSTTMMYWRRDRPDVYGYDKPLNLYPPAPLGLERPSKFPNITKGLVARGYSDQEIMKIWGENWLRVFKKVWGK